MFELVMGFSTLMVWGAILLAMRELDLAKRNIVFGVTLPPEEVEGEVVSTLRKQYKKEKRWLLGITVVLGIGIYFLPLPVSIMTTYFIIWTFGTMGMMYLPFYRVHKKLRDLKRLKGWSGGEKNVVYVDTTLARLEGRVTIAPPLLLIPLGLSIAGFAMMVFSKHRNSYDWMVPTINLITNGVLLLCMRFFVRSGRKVWSKKAEVNEIIHQAEQKGWTMFWFYSMMLSTISLLLVEGYSLEWITWQTPVFMMVLMVVIFVGTLGLLVVYQMNIKKLAQLVEIDQMPIYTDEDAYWLDGIFYCNPRDKKVLVSKRVGIGSTINLGNPIGKLVMGLTCLVTTSVLVVTLGWVLILDFSTPILSINEDQVVTIDYPSYGTHFKVEEIEEVQLIEEIPNSFKVNGGSTDVYARGYFTVKGYGEVLGFWYWNEAPYILIQLENRKMIYGENNQEETLKVYSLLKEAVEKEKGF